MRGLSIETYVRNFVKHIHIIEGFKKLTNMILGTFRGMICTQSSNSQESAFSLTSKFAFLTRIKTTVSLVTSSQNLQNTLNFLQLLSKSFINSATSEEQRLRIMGFAFTCYNDT